jgi:hypothetical protein
MRVVFYLFVGVNSRLHPIAPEETNKNKTGNKNTEHFPHQSPHVFIFLLGLSVTKSQIQQRQRLALHARDKGIDVSDLISGS